MSTLNNRSRHTLYLFLSLLNRPVPVLRFHVAPSTADDEDKQFVYLDVSFTLVEKVS